MHCFSTASEWLMALRWEVVLVKCFKELMNVIHEDRSWCFGNLRIFTFQPWPDHPESCAWVPKPNSRFSSNQAHSQQIQFRTWHQVCFPVSFPRQNVPYIYFITEKMTWMDILLLAASWPELFPVIWHNKTWQNYMNIRSNISQLLWSVMNLSHIIYMYNIE